MDKLIVDRMGWLDSVQRMSGRLDEIISFADEIRSEGFTHVVLMGMGGSSLSPEVSRLTFGVKEGYLDLMVLDSTVPEAVLRVAREIDPARTLFIVSTKSGTTVETLSAYAHFYETVSALRGAQAGESFIAITDPGTPLEKEAGEKGFRRVFVNFADIGGRYSALSYFGLVPTALIGADVRELMKRAVRMIEACGPNARPMDNPGIVLGSIIGEMALMGRDKLTLIMPPEIRSFGYWVEQLVAESTGKFGRGILPVESEFVGGPDRYGDDRLFVYFELASSDDATLGKKVNSLAESGQPVVTIPLEDVYDLGKEYFRWMIATAIGGALIGVEPFDQPNVQESKDITNSVLTEFKEKGALPQESPVFEENGISIFCDEKMKTLLENLGAGGSLASYLKAFLIQHQPGNYFAFMGFVDSSPEIEGTFQCMRAHLQETFHAATTLGYGPRFLHSTGQFHKGGPNNGLFIQFTADDAEDVTIPGQPYSFSTLKQAQAIGDAVAIQSKGRPFIRLHLGRNIPESLDDILTQVHRATE